MNLKVRNSILLFITAIVWGVAFVAQDVGMDYLTPFVFNGIRNILGAAVLLPVIFFRDKQKGENALPWKSKPLIIGGVLCGLALCIASNLQQFGITLSDESVGKAGFITTFYIILVPILGIALRHKCPKIVWLAAAMALVGLFFLCIPEGESLKIGISDLLIFLCALVFAIQIMIIDNFVDRVDGVKMACIQFFVCGVISSILALIFDTIDFELIYMARVPILYAGILSCGVGYTLQIVGQKGLNPTVASIIMSLESCVSVIAAWAILGSQMNSRQLLGCAIMFAAIILAQMPTKQVKKGLVKITQGGRA